jgi:hypothetical protein
MMRTRAVLSASSAFSVGLPLKDCALNKSEIELLLANGPYVIGVANDAEGALSVNGRSHAAGGIFASSQTPNPSVSALEPFVGSLSCPRNSGALMRHQPVARNQSGGEIIYSR